jgi:arylsulfatase A-like enzyme
MLVRQVMAIMAALCVLVMFGAAAQAAPPNIVIIIADDVGKNDWSREGGEIQTPNLDQLARSGVTFSAGYALPLCSPTRSAMLAGQYPQRYGNENNPPSNVTDGLPAAMVTVAEVLQMNGYVTMLDGKWHVGRALGQRPLDQGFSEFFGFLGSTHDYYAPTTIFRGKTLVTEARYLTEAFGDEAVAFIDRNAGRPFFLSLSFNAAHVTLQPLQKHLDRYPDISDPNRRAFAAMVASLDDEVGKVHEALVRNGLERNTLVFFTSDNGGAPSGGGSNLPYRGGKGTTYEGGIRVPMFASWPEILPAGIDYAHPVSVLDILPTFAAAARAIIPPDLDGVDLLPYLTGVNPGRPHDVLAWRVFGGTPKEWRAVRSGDLKLVSSKGKIAVFNLAVDPYETQNIATPELVQQLESVYLNETADWIPPKW